MYQDLLHRCLQKQQRAMNKKAIMMICPLLQKSKCLQKQQKAMNKKENMMICQLLQKSKCLILRKETLKCTSTRQATTICPHFPFQQKKKTSRKMKRASTKKVVQGENQWVLCEKNRLVEKNDKLQLSISHQENPTTID